MRAFGNTHKIVLTLVVGLVIGFGFGWLVFSEPTPTITEEPEEGIKGEEILGTQEEVTVNVSLGGSLVDRVLVEVKDQKAGDSVFISRVALKMPGWVAVHEDIDGNPGNILGAKRFDGGTFQGTVNLLRDTVAGGIYHVTVWEDDGDRNFDHDNDRLITGAGGIINMAFETY